MIIFCLITVPYYILNHTSDIKRVIQFPWVIICIKVSISAAGRLFSWHSFLSCQRKRLRNGEFRLGILLCPLLWFLRWINFFPQPSLLPLSGFQPHFHVFPLPSSSTFWFTSCMGITFSPWLASSYLQGFSCFLCMWSRLWLVSSFSSISG